ncbi:MAG: hypothetical protein PHO44_01100 [Sphaerochaetaceae bacterium]|nr:hypothetical protein [Sphaerochaetaceae bacterium]MDD3163196.1 hypothetical protein [Sphaerochaetaceae bacterium]MDD4006554.1 hypothetical protein [Sphaerochaetaceae bacterium]
MNRIILPFGVQFKSLAYRAGIPSCSYDEAVLCVEAIIIMMVHFQFGSSAVRQFGSSAVRVQFG